MFVCVCVGERERERERKLEGWRDIETQRYIERKRETEIETETVFGATCSLLAMPIEFCPVVCPPAVRRKQKDLRSYFSSLFPDS